MILVDRTSRAYQVRLGDNLVGRALQCDLRLDFDRVSRRHAVIHWDGQAATITDLGSTNGISLNGQRLIPHRSYPITLGDHLELAGPEGQLDVRLAARDSDIQLVSPPGPAAPAPVTTPSQPPAGATFHLHLGDNLLGRGGDCNLCLNFPLVSRSHAQITWDGHVATITDLHSTNGVLLDGQRLEPGLPYPLDAGAELQLGDPAARLEVQAGGVLALTAVAAAPKADVVGPARPPQLAVAEPLPFDHSLAVVVGINDYGSGIARLTTAVNDASHLAELLEQQHGYEVIRLIQDVTRDRLAALFCETLPQRLGENDRLLVYFAGHGVAMDGDDGPAGHLLPQDARLGDRSTCLAMSDLHSWLSSLHCRHLLAILDCCFAGAFQWAATRDAYLLPEVLHKERYDRFVRSPAWQVLTSAAFDQTALDVLAGDVKRGALSDDNGPHSPFARALFEALQGAADIVPRGQGDGVITATELYVYLRDRVEPLVDEQAQHEQTPGLWPLKKHRKGEYIFLTGQPQLPPAPELSLANNPYQGLQSYEERHSSLFFGREDEINALIQCVTVSPLTMVVGPSGTGKSSLVQAGLVPALGGSVPAEEAERQSGPGAMSGGGWSILPPLRPTAAPLKKLAQHLAPYLAPWGATPDAGHRRQDPQSLARALAAWRQANVGRRMLLIVDQLEELVTLCRDDDERDHFLALLAEAVRQHPDALRLVVTLRTDFEPQFADTPLFTDHGPRFARYVVPPMDQDDLRQVIEGPATRRVLYFEPPELVDRLINEVVLMPGALPLLSFTLSEMYLRYVRSGREDRALTQADYEVLGGVIGSLRQRATEEYDGLPDDAHRATMQRVMLRMISTEGGELARRRVMLSELEYPTAEENHRVQKVLDRLVEARLLVRGSSDVDQGGLPDPYVEPAHDALMTAWDRLLRWKGEAEEYLPLQRRTAQAAQEWVRAPESEKAGLLWNNDPRLPQLERALTPPDQAAHRGPLAAVRRTLWPDAAAPRDTAWLNRRELAFTQASVRRRAALVKRIVGITVAVIIALAGLAVFASLQASRAAQQRDVAVTAEAKAALERDNAQRQARNSRAGELAALSLIAPEWIPEQSLLLAVEAMSTTLKHNELAVPPAQQALRDVLGRPGGLPLGSGDGFLSDAAAFSPDGRWLATNGTSYDGMTYTVQLWSTAEPLAAPVILHGQPSRVSTMAFSPDGRWFATGSYDKNIRLWTMTDLEAEPMVLHETQSGIVAVQFSPDGHWLAALDYGYTVWLWDATGPQVNLQGTSGPEGTAIQEDSWLGPAGLAFSRDSRWLATAGPEGTALLWNVAGGLASSAILRGHQDAVRAVAFSSDSRWLATGSADYTVRLWDIAHPRNKPRMLQGHEWWVSAVAFSPDSTQLLTGGGDRFALLWDLSRPEAEPAILRNGKFPIGALAFSPDGHWIVTGSQWETHLWRASDPQATPEVLWGHEGSVTSVVFSPDSRWLATTAAPATGAHLNETVRLWNMSDLQADPVILAGHEGSVWAVAVSASSRWVATASWSENGRLRLWGLTDPPEKPTVEETYVGTISTLAFSPDDSRLAAACRDGAVRLWNPSDLAAGPTILDSKESNSVLGFSPDGILLVNGSPSGSVYLWSLADMSVEPSLLQGHSDSVTAANFSPDGRRLATSSLDGTVRVWDLGDLREEPLILRGDEPQVFDVDFSPDGRWLATGHGDAVLGGFDSYPARLWDLSDPQWQPTVLPGHKDNVRYLAFSPDGHWLATAPGSDFDTVIRLWDMVDLDSPPLLLQGHEETILAMAFSPDSRWLATGSADDTARLWDMANPQAEPVVLKGHGEMVEALAFSPDGRWLVTGSRDNTAFAWRIRQDDLLDLACLFAGRNFADAEWERYFPDEPYRKTCSDIPVHPSLAGEPEG